MCEKINWTQQVLPFDFWQEEEKPVQDVPYFEHPKNDNERLLNYQYEYRHGDDKALDKMYTLSMTIAGKFINQFVNKNKKVKHLSTYDRESKAQNAASYLIEQFIKRPKFAIRKSVTAYLWLRVEKELFYHRKVDGIVDFTTMDKFIKEGSEDKEYEKILGDIQMKKYIATSAKGKVKNFETQQELKAYFELTTQEFYKALVKGVEVIDPDTLEEYYIDEQLQEE